MSSPMSLIVMSEKPVKYIGFWLRFLAELIDTSLLTIASWALEYFLIGTFFMAYRVSGSQELGLSFPSFTDAMSSVGLQIFNSGIYFALAFPYYSIGHFRFGTTLGKSIFGIRVVDFDTKGPITMRQSVGRFFAFGLSYLTLCTGFLMVAFHPEKRALHELLSGTCSIRK